MMFQYCPNCTSQKLRFEDRRFWQCEDCDFTYFHNAAAAVAGILVHKNKVLFTVRAKSPGAGKLDLPGGFVDHDESLEQGLSREVNEELGIDIKPEKWRYLCSNFNKYQYKTIEYNTVDCVFVCQLQEQPVLTLEPAEISSTSWLSPSDINDSDMAFSSLAKGLKVFAN